MGPKEKKKAVKGAKKERRPRMVTKQIGGDKNGGTRVVRAQRLVSLELLMDEFDCKRKLFFKSSHY